jgi:hypothetical protein
MRQAVASQLHVVWLHMTEFLVVLVDGKGNIDLPLKTQLDVDKEQD